MFMRDMMRDLRYALRMMRRSPVFTLVVVLSLALGMGANTAIFSLINTLMLRMLPVAKPEQLVELLSTYPGEPRGSYFSREAYEYYRDHNHVLSGLAAIYSARFHLRAGFEPELVNGEWVSGSFFPVLGLKPAAGRLFGPAEDRAGSEGAAVAVLSWSYWDRRFHRDPSTVGARILVDNTPLTVIGVAPRPFTGLVTGINQDIWIPLAMEPVIHHPGRIGGGGLHLLGRLKDGVSIERAQAELRVLFRWVVEERAKNSPDPLVRHLTFELSPAGAGFSVIRDRLGKPLLALMAMVSLLLLVACSNIATLLLSRAAARQHEISVRVSLGAGRLRLARQMLTESLLVSFLGGLAGLAFAYIGARTLVKVLVSGRRVPGLPPDFDIPVHPDLNTLLFTGGIAILTGLLFGLAPAWKAFASTPASSLREGGKAGDSRLARFFGKSLVALQVAFSVALLAAAGLFLSHLVKLETLDLGFRRDDLLLMRLDPAQSGYDESRLSSAYRELLRRLESIPGVLSATLGAPIPLSGAGESRFVTVPGRSESPQDRRYVSFSRVAPEYFATMGIPLLSGRDFRPGDEAGAPVAIVNRAMSQYYFGAASPIGKYVTVDGGRSYEIVGVAGDAKYYDVLETPPRTVYLNAFQNGSVSPNFILHTSIPPERVAAQARREVEALWKTVPVERVNTMSGVVDASIVRERLIAVLSGAFGALGALLAAVGLYGLLAYSVARRVNEFGIRMALGASSGGVARMVFLDALKTIAAGLALGAPLALWANQLAGRVMQALPARSPLPLVSGAAAMLAIAILAAYVPARRASRVDPMEALRHE
jgi:predicted permease